jgi:hypothetical protein
MQPSRDIRANKRKQMKIKESKIAFFYFHLLTFIFSNRDFSTSYSRSKQKKFLPLRLRCDFARRVA